MPRPVPRPSGHSNPPRPERPEDHPCPQKWGNSSQSLLVTGPDASSPFAADGDPIWDTSWRLHLTRQAEVLCKQLWAEGIEAIFLDGSFVEAKSHPNDIDGYFACDVERIAKGSLQRALNQRDPKRCWTWDPDSRRAYQGYAKKQLPMWHAYRVELYPHYNQFTGLVDEHGQPLTFPAAFRKCRSDGTQKGIVEVIPSEASSIEATSSKIEPER